ncbi:hypothetical protein [Moraxella lacunata]
MQPNDKCTPNKPNKIINLYKYTAKNKNKNPEMGEINQKPLQAL